MAPSFTGINQVFTASEQCTDQSSSNGTAWCRDVSQIQVSRAYLVADREVRQPHLILSYFYGNNEKLHCIYTNLEYNQASDSFEGRVVEPLDSVTKMISGNHGSLQNNDNGEQRIRVIVDESKGLQYDFILVESVDTSKCHFRPDFA
ncbi:hypothetical protein [uncultured Endozoicomonas sp.]|uniref:hypothetical protein n=1 Tax=uncultured Endozoicomonas sp. TaxID=432652 RepID=UPI00262D7AEF|nr:hypothetical protein [uncultured Endozoicomonas sp.]